YGVGSTVSGGLFERHADWNLFAIAAPQNVAGVRKAFAEETARARRDGFTADELQRAKDAIGASSQLARAQDGVLAGALESFVERGKTPMYLAELDALRSGLTLDEVNAAFRKFVVPDKLVYGVAGDFANVGGAAAKAGGAGAVAPPK
ncbi:MAG: insulinase family protein, partial [Caldimonas sp.]